MIYVILYLIFSYLCGAIPYSVLISKTRGVNILEVGSKNAGATNVYRNLGFRYALIVFIMDMLKGLLPCFLAAFIFNDYIVVVLSGTLAIAGHTLSPFLKFKGGKGVATSIGVILYLQPLFILICGILALIIIKTTRYVSVASISGSALIIIMTLFNFPALMPLPYKIFFIVTGTYIIFMHRKNIKRLLKNEEKKV